MYSGGIFPETTKKRDIKAAKAFMIFLAASCDLVAAILT